MEPPEVGISLSTLLITFIQIRMSDFAQVDHIFNRKLNHISCYLFTAYERWGKAFVLMALKRSRLVYISSRHKQDGFVA